MRADETTIFLVFSVLLFTFALQAMLAVFLSAPIAGLILSAIAISAVVYFVDFN